MIKKLHYIKEDQSGNIEKFCLESYKRFLPDFTVMAWKPGSSPLKILYDEGGLFIGPGIIMRGPFEPEFSFLVFDDQFETTSVNEKLICYSDCINNPVFLEFMEKGIVPSLKERGFKNGSKFNFELMKETSLIDQDLGDIMIMNRGILGFDRKLKEYNASPFLDMNVKKDNINGACLKYAVMDKDTSSNLMHSVFDGYKDVAKKDDFLLLVNNGVDNDLMSRMTTILNYHCADDTKRWDVLNVGPDKDNVNDILLEYVSRRFSKAKGCEKIM